MHDAAVAGRLSHRARRGVSSRKYEPCCSRNVRNTARHIRAASTGVRKAARRFNFGAYGLKATGRPAAGFGASDRSRPPRRSPRHMKRVGRAVDHASSPMFRSHQKPAEVRHGQGQGHARILVLPGEAGSDFVRAGGASAPRWPARPASVPPRSCRSSASSSAGWT